MGGRVSVGIVNFDGLRYLPALKDAVQALEGPVSKVMIADDHSRDGGPAWIREHWPEAEVLAMPERGGPGPCRNALLAAAGEDLLLLLDNDALPRPDCLRRLLEALDGGRGACLVQARVLDGADPGRIHYDGGFMHYAGVPIPRNLHRPLAEAPESGPIEIDSFQAVCLLVRPGALLAAGGFDPSFFFYFEDADLAHRLRLRGETLLLAPRAHCLHLTGTEGLSQRGRAYPAARVRLHARNRWWLLLKCWRWRTLFFALPGLLLYEAAFFCLALARGHPVAWLQGKCGALAGLPRLWAARRVVQRARRLPDRRLLRGGPLVLLPQFQRGPAGLAARALGRLLALWWRLVRPLCG